eukprot:PhM_4_TR14429/c0_g1_i1/m.24227
MVASLLGVCIRADETIEAPELNVTQPIAKRLLLFASEVNPRHLGCDVEALLTDLASDCSSCHTEARTWQRLVEILDKKRTDETTPPQPSAATNSSGSSSSSRCCEGNASKGLVYHKEQVRRYLRCLRPVVLFFGGTSGSGKSTLSSVAAARFDIERIITTDSIRDILRGFSDPKTTPELFASTYEVHKVLESAPSSPLLLPSSQTQRVVDGFRRQCEIILPVLRQTVMSIVNEGASVVVEGVHLLVPWMYNMLCELESANVTCVPFVVHVKNEDKHLQRFAVRAKYMQLGTEKNRYAKNFDSIRTIQQYLHRHAAKHNITCIANSNVDKSVGIVLMCLNRTLAYLHEGKPIVDRDTQRAAFSMSKPRIDRARLTTALRERYSRKTELRGGAKKPPHPLTLVRNHSAPPASRVQQLMTGLTAMGAGSSGGSGSGPADPNAATTSSMGSARRHINFQDAQHGVDDDDDECDGNNSTQSTAPPVRCRVMNQQQALRRRRRHRRGNDEEENGDHDDDDDDDERGTLVGGVSARQSVLSLTRTDDSSLKSCE